MNKYLKHYGISGQKWGVRRYQNLDGSYTPAGRARRHEQDAQRIFVSGSWRISDNSSGFYRKKLPKEISNKLDSGMRSNSHFLVGDAPGVDTMTQDYLAKRGYKNVDIYVTGNNVRKNADDGTLGWTIHNVNGSMYPEGSAEWHAVKDKAMTRDATSGIAVILPDGGAGATRRNVKRLYSQLKDVQVFELRDKTSTLRDGWRKIQEVINEPD